MLAQTLLDDTVDFLGLPGGVLANRRWSLPQDVGNRRGEAPAAERMAPGSHLIEDQAEGEDVRARIDREFSATVRKREKSGFILA